MSEMLGGNDSSVSTEATKGSSALDASRIAEVKSWLVSQFDAVGKDIPDFEYTARSVAHLHYIDTISQAKNQAAEIVAMADLSLRKTAVAIARLTYLKR
nr:AUGMIN subunit 1-like [Ipomoea trifida]GME03614.1 AUGMIN subunit 1-like [Ipomoea batatas]